MFLRVFDLAGGIEHLPINPPFPSQVPPISQYYSQTTCPNDKVWNFRTLDGAVNGHHVSTSNRSFHGSATIPNLMSSVAKSTLHCVLSFSKTDKYCMHAFPRFASGRGVSIIADPQEVNEIINTELVYNSVDQIYPLPGKTCDFFETSIPGRGQGLISNHTYERGDLIMIARPVLIIDESSFDTIVEEDRFTLQRQAVEALPEGRRHLFHTLAGHWGGDAVEDRISTNAFGVKLGSNGKRFAVVVPEAAVSVRNTPLRAQH